MGIARAHGVADPEQLKCALRVGLNALGASSDQVVVIHFAKVYRTGAQVKVKIIQRHGAVIHHHLIIGLGFDVIAVIGADAGAKGIAVSLHPQEALCILKMQCELHYESQRL